MTDIDLSKDGNAQERKLTKKGIVILGISGAVFATVYAVTTPFLLPALRKICLPYVPATTEQVKNVITLLKAEKPKGRIIDLGSGDGRIVLEAARFGYPADGVELNPWLVWYSRIQALRLRLHKETHFYRKDLWKFNLAKYNTVVIFGVEQMMAPLEEKLKKELLPGSQIIACRFPLTQWKECKTVGEGIDSVWLYKQNKTSTSA